MEELVRWVVVGFDAVDEDEDEDVVCLFAGLASDLLS